MWLQNVVSALGCTHRFQAISYKLFSTSAHS